MSEEKFVKMYQDVQLLLQVTTSTLNTLGLVLKDVLRELDEAKMELAELKKEAEKEEESEE